MNAKSPDWFLGEESFERTLNEGLFFIIKGNAIDSSVERFEVKRESDGQIVLETESPGRLPGLEEVNPPGTLYTSAATIEFASPSGATATAYGVIDVDQNFNQGMRNRRGITKRRSTIDKIDIRHRPEEVGVYRIDWVSNVDHSLVLPNISSYDQKILQSMEFRGAENIVRADIQVSRSSSSGGCLYLKLDGVQTYLCRASSKGADGSGFILYNGLPTEETRQRIRDALSFFTGRYLIYLGNSTYGADWRPVSETPVSSYSLDGKAFTLIRQIPSPVSSNGSLFVEGEVASRFVQAILRHYDDLDFLHLSWAYWHAMAATPHIAGVHFGALVETLQRSYRTLNRSSVTASVMNKEDWRKLQDSLDALISSMEIPEETKTLLSAKIGDLNQIPHSMILQRVFESLGLRMSEAEVKSWKTRNNAAHGNKVDSSRHHDQIRDNKRLRLIFVRLILAITSAADLYNDDCSLGHPIRNVKEPVP